MLSLSSVTSKSWDKGDFHITEYEIELPIYTHTQVFGVDPGTTHLGLAYVWRDVCFAWEVKTNRLQSAPQRIMQMQSIMDTLLFYRDFSPVAIIEGASFADKYRQVELAEIRAAAIIWFISHGSSPDNILLFPPQTIRKQVFGSGKVKAHDVWTDLAPDAAAALSCCFVSTTE